MKTAILFSLISFFIPTVQDQDGISGRWKMAENNTEIEIKKDGDVLSGVVMKSDIEKAVGKEVIQNMKKEGDIWKGEFYVVRRDRTVNATLKQLNSDNLEMEVMAGSRSQIISMKRIE